MFYTKIHENFKIGDIGSTFSVKKIENDMKPVVHGKVANFEAIFNVVANEIWTFFNLSSFGT